VNIDRHAALAQQARPPAWAEATLCLLLRPRDRESVSGDLLEEYRKVIVPALGGKAGAWYIRQVAWYLLRASWMTGVLIGATLLIRYLFDTLAPVTYTPGVIHVRSQVMTDVMMATFALAATCAVWRTGYVRTGLLVSVSSSIIGGIISIAGTGIMLAIWHDPGPLTAWQTSGGLDEAIYGVPLMLVPIGSFTGMAGALVGKCLVWPLKRRP
jgi:hypothetical protein